MSSPTDTAAEVIVASGEQRILSGLTKKDRAGGTNNKKIAEEELYIKSYNVASPKAQLLITHGYLEHCLRYEEFAKTLATKYGISVTLYDCRGHGRSTGDRAYLDNWELYIQDLKTVLSTLSKNKTVPIFLLGHSNGGAITMDYLIQRQQKHQQQDPNNDDNIKGIILSSPYFAPADGMGQVQKFLAMKLGSYFPSLKLPSPLKSHQLTTDVQKQQEHDKDEMNLSSITAGWACQCIMAQERIRNAVMKDEMQFTIPILFAYADADQVSDAKYNERIAEKLQSDDKTILKREGKEHEILNEVDREELYESIAEWILKRV